MKSEKPVILVVEDEVLIRMVAVSVAEESGFEVLSAVTADEAIGILESRSDIRLVFTDVHMPGSMDGLRLAHAVRGRWPPVELLVTSALGNVTARDLPERGASCQSLIMLQPYRGFYNRWQEIRYGAFPACASASLAVAGQ
jgi:CheY-like chemotaxis protein